MQGRHARCGQIARPDPSRSNGVDVIRYFLAVPEVVLAVQKCHSGIRKEQNMEELLFAFLGMLFDILFQAVLNNRSTAGCARFLVKLLVIIGCYAGLSETLPFDQATSARWSMIITISVVAVYYLFKRLRQRIRQEQDNDLYSPSNSSENTG